MASKLTISYDQEGDLLEIAFGSARPAISEELISNLFVRYDLATYDEEKNEGEKIIGFTVANISLWKDENFRTLDKLFPGGVLKEIIQCIKGSLVGKPLEIIAAETWRHKPKTINELWHIDISYIPCGINDKNKIIFWYLIVVLDGFSRYVIAWDLFPDMKKERCFDIVDQAVFLSQVPEDKRPNLLSDNGKQFRAKSAKEFFKGLLNIKQIFSSPNHPETNGKIERLFQTVKYESLYREDYCSAKEAKKILLDFFNEYNNFRFHQALEYRTPRESYYGLNKDYTKRRQEAKGQIIKGRKEYWTKSGETLTFQKAKNLLKH